MHALLFVLKAAACGACAVIAWDLVGAFREAWRLDGFIGNVIDFISPSAFMATVWFGVIYMMDGSTRIYGFLCIASGIILYIFTVRKYFFRMFYAIFEYIHKIIGFIFKILLTPAQFLYKMLYVKLYIKQQKQFAETEKTADDPKD